MAILTEVASALVGWVAAVLVLLIAHVLLLGCLLVIASAVALVRSAAEKWRAKP